jgi:hypothetical protein
LYENSTRIDTKVHKRTEGERFQDHERIVIQIHSSSYDGSLYKSNYPIRIRPRIKATNSISKALYINLIGLHQRRDKNSTKHTNKKQSRNLCLHHPNQSRRKKQKRRSQKKKPNRSIKANLRKAYRRVHGTPGWSQPLQNTARCRLGFKFLVAVVKCLLHDLYSIFGF